MPAWRLRMKSGLPTVDHHAARSFAANEGWAGAGWGLTDDDGIVDGATDFAAYLRLALPQFSNPASLTKAGTIISQHMAVGDFVFMYDTAKGEYWCGIITGPFVYRHGGDFDRFDLHLLRPCRWKRMGTADAVLGALRRAFAGPFGVVSRIVTKETEIIHAAKIALGLEQADRTLSFFDAASPDDLEDVAALYLQGQGWSVYPSTAKQSMANYEFILTSSDGRRAAIQVKSGFDSWIAPLIPNDIDVFFVLMRDPKARIDGTDTRIVRLNNDAIEQFAESNWAMLPKRLQALWPR